jgi:hypothetical protein
VPRNPRDPEIRAWRDRDSTLRKAFYWRVIARADRRLAPGGRDLSQGPCGAWSRRKCRSHGRVHILSGRRRAREATEHLPKR